MVETLIAGLVAAGLSAGTATFIVTTTLAALASTVLSFAVRALTKPGSQAHRPNSFGIENLRKITRSNIAPVCVIYGTTHVSGVLAFAESDGGGAHG